MIPYWCKKEETYISLEREEERGKERGKERAMLTSALPWMQGNNARRERV